MSDDDAGPADEVAPSEAIEPQVGRSSGGSPPGRGTSRIPVLALIAVALGGAAAVSWILAIWRGDSSFALWATVAVAIAGVVFAVVALERRDHRALALSAVTLASVVGVFAFAGALPQPDLEAHVYGYADAPLPALDCPTTAPAPSGTDADFWAGAFYATELSADGVSASAPLDFETKVSMSQTATQMPAMSMTVGRPVDATQAAADASVPPPQGGVYLAIPVTYADPDEQTFSCLFSPAFPSSWWLAESGEEFALATVSIPDFPTLEDGGVPDPTGDSLVYYDVFDVTPGAAVDGSYYTVLLTPDATEQSVYWGADR